MTSEPPKTYDCEAFINYLPNIDTSDGFLKYILDRLDDINQSLVKGMIGILTDSNDKDLPPDLTLLYDNWGPSSYSTYIEIITTEFLENNPAGDEEALNNLAQFSGFLLNFYFCFNSPGKTEEPKIINPGSKFYSAQTDSLLNFFKDETVRGIGNEFVNSYCNYILVDVPIKDRNKYLSQNPRLMEWCGCFADIYEFITKDEDPDFPQECYPICVNSSAIKLFDTNGNKKTCISHICIISDISIRTVQTPNGFINFNKLCTACMSNDDQTCLCIIDSSVMSLLSKIGAGNGGLDSPVNFNIYCPNATCLLVNEFEDVVEKVDCNEFNPAATGVTPLSSSGGSISTDGVSLNDEASILFILLSCFFIFLCIGIYSFGKSIFIKKSSF